MGFFSSMGRVGSIATGGALSGLPGAPGALNRMPQLARKLLKSQPQYNNLKPLPGKQGQDAKMRGGSPLVQKMIESAQEGAYQAGKKRPGYDDSKAKAAAESVSDMSVPSFGAIQQPVPFRFPTDLGSKLLGDNEYVRGIGVPNVPAAGPPPEYTPVKQDNSWIMAALGGGAAGRRSFQSPTTAEQAPGTRLNGNSQAESRLLNSLQQTVRIG